MNAYDFGFSSDSSLSSPTSIDSTYPTIRVITTTKRNDRESFLRVLLNDNSIKYLVLRSDVNGCKDLINGGTLLRFLKDEFFNSNRWNFATFTRHSYIDRRDVILNLSAPIGNAKTWYLHRHDWTSIKLGQELKPNVNTAEDRHRPDQSYVIKYMHLPPTATEYTINKKAEVETEIYRLIQGHDIGPRFLGHMMEGERCVGAVLERIVGRAANPGDVEACSAVVRRLHALGIVHGDLHERNFIITPTRAVLIDFATSFVCRHRDIGK